MAEKRPLCNYAGQLKEIVPGDVLLGSPGLIYSVISVNTNAEAGKGYLVNASSGNVTLTLPGTPSVGDSVAVVDIYNKATTNVVTIARNGSNIEGSAEDMTIDIDGAGFVLVYADATRGWEIVSEIGVSIPSGVDIYHGVESMGTLSFDSSTHVISIASITYWYKGVRYVTASPTTCDLDLTADRDHVSATLTTNTLYYIYFKDSTGKLYWSPSVWNLYEMVSVATVFWNGSEGAVYQEDHGHKRDIAWHIWAHTSIGCRYITGLDKTYPTAASDAVLQIESGSLLDEDKTISIGQQTTMRGWYKVNSGTYTFANYSLPYLGTLGAPVYLDTDTYALTTFASNKYIAYWVFGTGDKDRPIAIIPSHVSAPYSQVVDARAELAPSITGLNPEWKLIYRWIYSGDGQFVESSDYRLQTSIAGGVSASTIAGSVAFTPSGNIASTNVQSAIEELDTEKAPLISPSFTTPALGTPSSGTLTNCTGLPQAGVTGLTTTDSPVFGTVKLSNLTDGYLPKHTSDAVGLVNSPIYTDGTNISLGTTSVVSPLTIASSVSVASLGSELLTDQTGVVASANGVVITKSLAVVSGESYYITWTQTHSVANNGFVLVKLGTVSGISACAVDTSALNNTNVIVANTTGTVDLTFTISSYTSGTITISDTISVKLFTKNLAVSSLLNSDNSVGLEYRPGGSSGYNTFIGLNSGQHCMTGTKNSAHGCQALFANTTGTRNAAIGNRTLFNNTTGSWNLGIGTLTLFSCTTGYRNTVIGDSSLYSLTTGYSNIAIGTDAGRFLSNGSYTNKTPVGGVYLGDSTKVLTENGSNEIVIGYNAIGAGSNTTTIGNTSITKTVLRGNITGGNLSIGANYSAVTAPTNGAIFEGNVGILNSSPTAALDVNSDILRLRTAKTPASAGDTGNAGDICWDSSYIYICTATNTWKRAAIATWT